MYKANISKTKRIIYDIFKDIGLIIYYIALIICFIKKPKFMNYHLLMVMNILVFVLMFNGTIELIVENFFKLNSILPKIRLYRGYGLLMLGGIIGFITSLIAIIYTTNKNVEIIYLYILSLSCILCAIFSGLIFKEFKKFDSNNEFKNVQNNGIICVQIKALSEKTIQEIGQAFSNYDYINEHGLIEAFPNRKAASSFICGYVKMALKSQMLYTTSENGEGYIAYKISGQKVRLIDGIPLAQGLLKSMKLKELIRFIKIMSKGGTGLTKQFDKTKKPYIYVGLVCVLEKYQKQGYMRKLLDIAFSLGNKLNLPVILDTDAKSKCDKYIHLGMELVNTRHFGEYGMLYDLIKYPDLKN